MSCLSSRVRLKQERLCGAGPWGDVTAGPCAADLLTQPLAAHLAALAAPSFTIPAIVDVVLRYAGMDRSPRAFNPRQPFTHPPRSMHPDALCTQIRA